MGFLEEFRRVDRISGPPFAEHRGFKAKQPSAGIGDRPGGYSKTEVLFVKFKEQVDGPEGLRGEPIRRVSERGQHASDSQAPEPLGQRRQSRQGAPDA